LKIKFYGKLGGLLGDELEIDPPGGAETISELRGALSELYPEASPDLRGRSMACVDDRIVSDGYRFSGADVVEFFPPLSGG
jgi:molybdopterin converting factor small subunit